MNELNNGQNNEQNNVQNNEQNNQQNIPQQNNNQQYDPYNQPQQNNNQQYDPYNQPQQNNNQQYDPYNQPQQNNNQQFNPYNQPNPYAAPMNGYGAGQMGKYPTGMATASLVIGIVSLVLMIPLLYVIPFPVLGIVGIILGAIYKSKHYPVGKTASTAGIITSAISIGLYFLLIIAIVIIAMNYMPELMQYLKDYSPTQYEQLYNQYHSQFPQWFEGVSALIANIARFF